MLNVRVGSGTCEHVPAEWPAPRAEACEDCGSTFNLRMCATCGYVGCCESQAGHDREHALGVGHPVIASVPVGEGFVWCYDHHAYVG